MVRRKPRRRGHGHGLGSRDESPEYSTRTDLALIEQSVDGSWRLAQEIRDQLVVTCWQIFRDGRRKDRDRLAACRVLASVSKSPQHGTFAPSYAEQSYVAPRASPEELLEALGVMQEAGILPGAVCEIAADSLKADEVPDSSPRLESSP